MLTLPVSDKQGLYRPYRRALNTPMSFKLQLSRHLFEYVRVRVFILGSFSPDTAVRVDPTQNPIRVFFRKKEYVDLRRDGHL